MQMWSTCREEKNKNMKRSLKALKLLDSLISVSGPLRNSLRFGLRFCIECGPKKLKLKCKSCQTFCSPLPPHKHYGSWRKFKMQSGTRRKRKWAQSFEAPKHRTQKPEPGTQNLLSSGSMAGGLRKLGALSAFCEDQTAGDGGRK